MKQINRNNASTFQLPHLGYFAATAILPLIGYGVFMTSILFPSHELDSWRSLLVMLIRPYLLLFAETGMAHFDCMYQGNFSIS